MKTKQIFVCVTFMLAQAFIVHAQGTDSGTEGLDFELINNNTAYRVRSGAVSGGEIRIPEYYNGKPVTEIGGADDDTGAFERTSVTAIHIPLTVTTIGRFAFYECDGLVTVTFADGSRLETIGNSAFSRCESLAGITIPANVTVIGSYAFSRCYNIATVTFADGSLLATISNDAFADCGNLTGIEIPATVTIIGNSAFWQCRNITAINIPAGVKEISSQTFEDCIKLITIEIPASVTEVESSAISGCTGLASIIVDEGNPKYASLDGILYNKAKTEIIFIPQRISGNIIIPAGITEIDNQAFSGRTSLETVTFAEGSQLETIGNDAFSECGGLVTVIFAESSRLEKISNYAFYQCKNLTSITIPASVTTIGDRTFTGCTSLTSIKVDDNNPHYAGENGILYNKEKSVVIAYPAASGAVTIPERVTTIGNSAFWGCTSLVTVIFAEGSQLETIGNYAFLGCRSLTTVTFAEGSQLETIGNSAFSWCESLTSITIPASVTSIGDSTFYSCSSLRNIIIDNDSVTFTSYDNNWGTRFSADNLSVTFKKNPGNYAFYKCTRLTSITITESVTTIGGDAFSGCSNLTGITIPASVTSIGNRAFSSCTSLASIIVDEGNSNYASLDGILYNKGKTEIIFIPLRISGNIIIPAGLTEIGNQAFSSRTSLTGIAIPASVTSIGNRAFSSCTSLTGITIPASVTSIGYEAFSSCTSLTSITVDTGNPNYASEGGILYNKTKITLIQAPEGINSNVTIPASVTFIGSGAFNGCTSLAGVTIPTSVRYIGDSAFSGCESLTSITIPESVTSIGKYTFYGCSSLRNIIIDNDKVTFDSYDNNWGTRFSADNLSVTFMKNPGNYAFYRCTRLTSITISTSVTSIGDSAFNGCSRLTSITIPENVTSIGESAFSGCSSLTSITIPASVTSIGNRAFSSCISLTSITVDAGNPNYTSEGGILYNIEKTIILTFPSASGSIVIPAGVTSIGGGAFSGCSNLATVTFAEGSQLEIISNRAFYQCKSLTSITIPASVTTIGDRMFTGCTSLTSIKVDENNPHYAGEGEILYNKEKNVVIAYPAASGTVTIPARVTAIGNSAFYDCTSLTTVTFSEGSLLETISNYAFSYCTSLTSITIPAGVTSIGGGAFSGCRNLATVTFSEGSQLGTISSDAFSYCTSLAGITIPASVTSIGYEVFYQCSKLAEVICLPTTPPTLGGTKSFQYTPGTIQIKVSAVSVASYKTAKNWNSYVSRISAIE